MLRFQYLLGEDMIEHFLLFSDNKSAVHFTVPENMTLNQSIEASDVHQALYSIGAGQFYLFEKEIETIISAINTGNIASINNVLIAQRLNAEIAIDLQENEMIASMTVTGAYGGHPLRAPEIIEVLSHHHIVKGIKKENLKALLIKSKNLEPGEVYSNIIACGRRAEEGQDTVFEPLVPNIKERILQPQEMDDGHVDMRNLGDVISVKKNTPLMRRIPATLGINGNTVTGKIITAAQGNDIPFTLFPGSFVSQNDPNLLLSNIDGTPLIHHAGVSINNLLTLKRVNATTGHVSFEGSIFIQEDIESGMKVTATGSIIVGGFIENAEVTAKHDITVINGIIGRPVPEGTPLTCIVNTEGQITTKLAQNSHLMAHSDIRITLHANHCLVESLGSIVVIDETEKNGTISGGSVTANGSIKTANLGIEGGAYTKVHAFHHFNTQKENLHLLQKRLDDANAQVVKIAQINISRQPPELAEKILRSKEKSTQDLLALKSQLEKEHIIFNAHLRESHIFVTNKIFPRVDIQFNTEHLITKREYSPSKISYSGYEINIDPVMIKKKI